MRLATMDKEILNNDAGEFMGIRLGADYCAEHEWGIKGLAKIFNLNESAIGVERRKIQPNDLLAASLHFIEGKEGDAYLIVKASAVVPEHNKELLRFWKPMWRDVQDSECPTCGAKPRQGCKTKSGKLRYDTHKARNEAPRKRHPSEYFVTAWDEGSLGIHVDAEHAPMLRELYEAMLKGDAACWLGGGGGFSNAGIFLCVVSRLPQEWIDKAREVDIDAAKLEAAAEATKIKVRVKASGRSFFALSPRWRKEHDKPSAYNVVFWLNPYDQQKHNWGWFTVEELDAWTRGEGPVMK